MSFKKILKIGTLPQILFIDIHTLKIDKSYFFILEENDTKIQINVHF